MTELLVVRHGQSTWNAERRWAGWGDPPLSEEGRATAASFAETLVGAAITAVVTSDLLRALQTGEVVAAHLGLPPPARDPGLREIDVGAWTGKTTEEIEAEWPGWLERWRSGEIFDPPGGEDRDEFDERVVGALVRVGTTSPGRSLVVTHSGTVRALCRYLGRPAGAVGNLDAMWATVTGGTLVGSGLNHSHSAG